MARLHSPHIERAHRRAYVHHAVDTVDRGLQHRLAAQPACCLVRNPAIMQPRNPATQPPRLGHGLGVQHAQLRGFGGTSPTALCMPLQVMTTYCPAQLWCPTRSIAKPLLAPMELCPPGGSRPSVPKAKGGGLATGLEVILLPTENGSPTDCLGRVAHVLHSCAHHHG